jgi:hypothetical protein
MPISRWISLAVLTGMIACADGVVPTSPHASLVLSNASSCTVEQGQQFINAGQYTKAINEFACVIDADPTAVEGYRGQIEAEVMLGRYSDALRDFQRIYAFVVPVHPDAGQVIVSGYQARLAADPASLTALMGLTFAQWALYSYPATIHVANDLLAVQPNNVVGILFRGSSRMLHGQARAAGAADLEQAIALAPLSADVRFVVADAYTYGSIRDYQRAFNEATFALNHGLDTPRVRAIRGAAYLAAGNLAAAAVEIDIHFAQVTTELVATAPLAKNSSMTVGVAPGRSFEIPLVISAGEPVSIATTSKDLWDTIVVLLAPNGTPVAAGDDFKGYMAGFDWTAPAAGTYRLRVTSFEAVSTGAITVTRK